MTNLTKLALIIALFAAWLAMLWFDYPVGRHSVMLMAATALCLFNLTLQLFRKRPFALICSGAVIVLGVLIVFLRNSHIDWHRAIVEDWYVGLVVIYLPLMGMAWFGYTKFKTGKGRYDN